MVDLASRFGRPRILCVDDEPHVLEALQRSLRAHYDITTAVGGQAALDALRGATEYDVIMTDMRMPVVDGVAVLRAAREHRPDATRVLLTGQADLTSAVAAVNDGNVFRFLLKPCPPESMKVALDAAVEQSRLHRVEHELLEGTLKGAIQLCMEVIALVHPQALSRGARVRRIAALLAQRAGGVEVWAIEVAALLSHIGAITLPPEVLDKLHRGQSMTLGEMQQLERIPRIGAELVAKIPRLEAVRDMLLYQRTQFDGLHTPTVGVVGNKIPVGARILMIADDYDLLEARELSPAARMRVMSSRKGVYDPVLLDLLREALEQSESPAQMGAAGETVRLESVRLGTVFGEDVIAPNGIVLIGRGQAVSVALLERIRVLSVTMRSRLVRMLPR